MKDYKNKGFNKYLDYKHSKVTEPTPQDEITIGVLFVVVVLGGWLVLNLI